MNNASCLLAVYDVIRKGTPCRIQDMINACDCSRRTCFHYVREIRFHLIMANSPSQIYYDNRSKRYALLDSADVRVIEQNLKFLMEYPVRACRRV